MRLVISQRVCVTDMCMACLFLTTRAHAEQARRKRSFEDGAVDVRGTSCTSCIHAYMHVCVRACTCLRVDEGAYAGFAEASFKASASPKPCPSEKTMLLCPVRGQRKRKLEVTHGQPANPQTATPSQQHMVGCPNPHAYITVRIHDTQVS